MNDNEIKLREQQVELLESLAVMNEKMGIPPAASKIMALLMVSDTVELSFEQIMVTLNLSKGATSQGINQLLQFNRIDYKTKIGDRKRYFFSKVAGWDTNILNQMQLLGEFVKVYKKVLDQRPKETEAFNNSLNDMISFMQYIVNEIPIMLARYSENK